MKNTILAWMSGLILFLVFSCSHQEKPPTGNLVRGEKPRIVNIINFIRLLEPRDVKITEDVLYQTVVQQIEIMNQ